MKKKTRNAIKAIIVSICLVTFIILVRLLLKDKIHVFDELIYNLVIKLKSKPATCFFKFITIFCNTWFIITLIFLIVIFGKNRNQKKYIILNSILCLLINLVLKLVFSRGRPIGINIITARGYSFPSGHSMLSVAFYGFIGYLVLHSKKCNVFKTLVIGGTMLLAFLIGISRIYLGVHYASDVLAGFVLSLAYLILFVTIFWNEKKRT